MNSYRIYNLHDIDLNEVYAYSKYSVGKFEYLFGHEGTTKFYYKYNFFTLASCNKEIHKMYRQLTGFVGEFLSEVSYPDDNVWMQSWMNFHKEDEVLKSHNHDFDVHGYITISNHKSDTVFTEGEKELWRIENKPLQIYIGTGRVNHHVEVTESYKDERITIGFDLALKNSFTNNFSFIPVVI